MTDWCFAEPEWIHLAWAVLAVAVLLLWLDHRGSRGLERFLDAVMHDRLVHRPSGARRTWRIVLLTGAALAMVTALMRPQSGFHEISTPRMGARLMVCLDVSRSMLAEDVAPNRLERAKVELLDLLSYIDEDHVGLIAFAGRAAVLCPMTSDFGFLRTVIQAIGTRSVSRGGTDLESPIRKAVEGFRGRTDLARVIILITDGDHHDKFVLDAARHAGEQGVRIICIGFGDEAGSRIVISDPKTGAKTTVVDADGNPVITRLGGEVLRDIALATEGVYIPAGTGVLDLKAIYEAHIEPLTRGTLDDHHRVVKQERYQWPLLASLALLLAALFVARPHGGSPGKSTGTAFAVATLFTACLLVPPTAFADDVGPDATASNTAPATESNANPPREASESEPPDPRVAYNSGVAALGDGRLDDADTAFALARQHAGTDAVVRYKATYNLGWIEVRRAEEKLKDAADAALEHLHAAETWFREATQMEPEAVAPRENLQIIARRALALADALQRKDGDAVESRLDALVTAQRAMAEALRDAFAASDGGKLGVHEDSLRLACQALEVEQRAVLNTIDEVGALIQEQIASLEAIAEKERTTQQALRAAQLTAAEQHLFDALQRVGQTRRHLRGRQLERGYRRAAISLGALKRSRDQLRDVVEVLGAVATDAVELTRQASIVAADDDPPPSLTGKNVQRPAWLTRHYLADVLPPLEKRTEEIAARLRAGIEGGSASAATDTTDQAAADAALLEILAAALPIVEQATHHFETARHAIEGQRDHEIYVDLAQGTGKLIEAQELFLDVRGLIETIHRDEQQIATIARAEPLATVDAVLEVMPMLAHWQRSNLQRGKRLGDMFQRGLDDLPASAPSDAATGKDPDLQGATDGVRQQFETAQKLLATTMQAFKGVDTVMQRFETATASANDITTLRDATDLSVQQVEALRRLFFSIVEHLRDTLQRQVSLADDTRDAMTGHDTAPDAAQRGPLAGRQRTLLGTARQIAASLRTQSEQKPPTDATAAGPPPQAADQAVRLGRAAAIVLLAADAMATAADNLSADTPEATEVRDKQHQSIDRLHEALQLLSPPPPPQQQQADDKQEESPQPQASEGEEEEEEEATPTPHGMQQLLQAVRDRDAQRQQERQKGATGYTPVEKDW